ncbi:MAG: hypothetical protein V1904_09410, partial [Bacteroidota bacterium]
MKNIIITICCLVLTAFSLEAQEMLGIINSNYSGVNGLCMNPAYMADSKLYLDINILAPGASYQTNSTNNAFGNFRLNGPSVMLNRGEHAFAFVDAARTAISYRKISANAGNYTEYQVAGLAWGEVGLSYAKILRRADKTVKAGGLTIKGLFGAGGAFFASNDIGYTGSSNDVSGSMQSIGFSGGGGMG